MYVCTLYMNVLIDNCRTYARGAYYVHVLCELLCCLKEPEFLGVGTDLSTCALQVISLQS